jgi:Methyltransferase domain
MRVTGLHLRRALSDSAPETQTPEHPCTEPAGWLAQLCLLGLGLVFIAEPNRSWDAGLPTPSHIVSVSKEQRRPRMTVTVRYPGCRERAMALLHISRRGDDDAARNHPLSYPMSPQAALFDRTADTYDQLGVDMFHSVAERLVVELSPTAGVRALDVGCGRGGTLARLARAVLPHGDAIGIDLSPRLVELPKADLEAAGVHAEVGVGDAIAPEFDRAGYDLIAASLVVFSLPDPVAALRAWRRLLVDGGRVHK